MPTKTINAKVLENLKPPATGRLELWDTVLPRFGLRVTDKDVRTYFVMYWIGDGAARKKRRMTIGNAKIMELGKARDAARKALEAVDQGIDPAGSAIAAPETPKTFKLVAADYLERYAKQNTRDSTYQAIVRLFAKDVSPFWDDRLVNSITRSDVEKLIHRFLVVRDKFGRPSPVQANRALARLRAFFNWCIDQEIITASPVARMKPPTKEQSRDRALTDEEIVWFWKACDRIGNIKVGHGRRAQQGEGWEPIGDEIGWPFGPLFKLLLLTAQRRTEVGGMAPSEINRKDRLWIIPRERAKNNVAHEVALSDTALDILDSVAKVRAKLDHLKNCPFIFSTTGTSHVSGFGRAKEHLDAEMEKLARQARGYPEDDDGYRAALKLGPNDELPRIIPQWNLHDLRRTATTGMARMNFPPHVVDRILNHVSGTISSVAAVYNRHSYAAERRTALEAWEKYVLSLVHGTADNVVPLHAAG